MKSHKHFVQKLRLKFTRQAVGRMFFWGSILLCLWIFIKTGAAFESNTVLYLDEIILRQLFLLRSGPLNGVAVDITALGSATVITIFTIASVTVLLLSNDKYGAIQLAAASIGNSFLSPLMKNFFGRERPDLVPHLVEVMHFSYPSGHSLAAASTYLTLALLGCRHLKGWNAQVLLLTLAILIILMIGTSRIYLGVHYPSDVLGGICLGAAWALLLGWFISILEQGKKLKVP